MSAPPQNVIEWVEALPPDWRAKRLGSFATVKARLGWKGLKAEEYVEQGYIFLATPNIKGVEIDFENVNFITEARYNESPEIMLKQGDILIVKDGGLGFVAQVTKLPAPATVNGSIAVVRPNGDCQSRYLFYWLRSDGVQQFIQKMKGGMGLPHLFQSDLRRFPVALPPSAEQRRIAGYLDEATGKVDRLMALRQRQMELLREQRAALIQQAVTRGLNPNAPLKDSGNPCLPEIPAAWSSTKLKYLGKVVSGFAFDSADFTDAGIRVLKIANIQTMRLDWSEESFVPDSFYERYPTFAVADGDLVFALTRPIISTGLKAAIANIQGERVLLNQRNAVFKPNKRVEREFLYYAVFSRYFAEDFESRIDETGQQPNISPVAVADIPIALPSLPEQQAIVRFIQGETHRLDRLLSAYTRQIELLTEYRAALIQERVTGQRAVPN